MKAITPNSSPHQKMRICHSTCETCMSESGLPRFK